MLMLIVRFIVAASPLDAFHVEDTGFEPTQASKGLRLLVLVYPIFVIAPVLFAMIGMMSSRWS